LFKFGADGRVTRYKLGASGTFTTAPGYFETLVMNADGSFTLTTKDETVYTVRLVPGTPFLVVGPVYRLTQIVTRNGDATVLTYAGGDLVSVTNTYGQQLTFTYTAQRKLASIMYPDGRAAAFLYDATGRKVAAIVRPTGEAVQYSYNTLYQPTAKIDGDGRRFTYSYVAAKPVAVNDGNGEAPAHLSNPGNWATDSTQLALNLTRVYIPATTTNVDGRGNVWQYDYDANGYITRQVAPDGATTRYTYDPATLTVSSRTDPNGNLTTFQYDARGNRTKMTDALGHVTTYTYEPVFNMMTSMTDPRGRTTTYAYDAHGNRIHETDRLGQIRTWTYDSHGNVLSETDKNGHTTSYEYDAVGNRTKRTDAIGNVTTMTYDTVGNLLSFTDANGHTTSFQYDALNRRIDQTDPAGRTSHTAYDAESNRVQVIDRNGHSTASQYDLRSRPIKVVDHVGSFDTFTYDGNDNRVSTIDRNGHVTTSQYDVQNRLIATIDALGHVTTSAYDPAGNVISLVDGNGHTTVYTYDALSRLIRQTDAVGNLTQSAYDGGTLSGCPSCGVTPGSRSATAYTDANGKVTYLKYDGLDRLIKVVRKVGGTADTIMAGDAVTSYGYDPVGNRLSETEPNGNTTTFVYDAIDRRITETNAAGDETLTGYDGVGNVVATTAPNGNVTATVYDALNRPSIVTDSVGAVANRTYDAAGNRLTETDGNGNTTSDAYDTLNRLVATTDPLGKVTTLQYDAVGNLLKTIDRNGHARTSIYDAINRRVSDVDALGHVTSYQYDAVGNRLTIADANSHSTQYQYDAVDRLTAETYADGKSRSFTYDGVGNIVTRTDQNGSATTYRYDDLYFLLGRSYPSLVNDSFTYDLSGRMLSATRGSWPVTFAYDGANRLTSTSQNGRTMAYAYDITGRTRTVTYPGGRSIVEQTDPRGRLDRIDDGASPSIVRYSYDAGNRVTSRFYRNATTATYTYDANDRIASLDHTGAGPIARFTYNYDHEKNKTFEEKSHLPARSEAYQYDAADRLVDYKVGTLVGSTVPVPATQTAYNLDPIGNWSSTITDGVTQTRTHDAVNELTAIDATPLLYDANGNLRVDGRYNYVYDEENRLVRVTRNSDSAIVGQYLYDALGRRVVRVASPSAAFVTTLYFYDGTRVVEEQDHVGTTQATYAYGNYVDEVLTMDRDGQANYYHQNALWSVEAVTDGAGNVTERYAYDAYGAPGLTNGGLVAVPPNPWSTAHSAIGNPWMFTGRQFDEETGLYFYRARSYDPIKGRFLQRDPIEYVTSMNLYEYARSAPTVFTDPSGMVCCSGPLKSLCAMGDCPEKGEVCKWVPAEDVGGGGIADMLGNCGCTADWKEWIKKQPKEGEKREKGLRGLLDELLKEEWEREKPGKDPVKDPKPPKPWYERPPFTIRFW
jgi:RHS repeat-associated protein